MLRFICISVTFSDLAVRILVLSQSNFIIRERIVKQKGHKMDIDVDMDSLLKKLKLLVAVSDRALPMSEIHQSYQELKVKL